MDSSLHLALRPIGGESVNADICMMSETARNEKSDKRVWRAEMMEMYIESQGMSREKRG